MALFHSQTRRHMINSVTLFEQKISHSLALQKSNINQIRLHEMVVWTPDNQKCQGLITSVFWSFRKNNFEKRDFHQIVKLDILSLKSP